MVQLPTMNEAAKMYFGSVQDEVVYTDGEDTYYKNLTCNVVCKQPSRYAGG